MYPLTLSQLYRLRFWKIVDGTNVEASFSSSSFEFLENTSRLETQTDANQDAH